MAATGTNGIIAEIEKKAEEQVASLLKAAEGKAEEILVVAKEKAETHRTEVLKRATIEAEREARRIVVRARTEAKQDVLRLKENLVEQVFSQAQEMLHKIEEHQVVDGVKYEDVIKHLLRNSAIALGESPARIYCREQDRNIFQSVLLADVEAYVKKETGEKCKLELAEGSIHATGGLVLRNADERIQVDNTFEAIIDRLHEVFCAEVTHKLFDE